MGILSYLKDISLENRINKTERLNEQYWNSMVKDEKENIWLRNWYLRLKEKFKFDKEKLIKITEDWNSYIVNADLIFHGIRATGWGGDDELIRNDIEESYARNYEIENRFAELLGSEEQQQLKNLRKN